MDKIWKGLRDLNLAPPVFEGETPLTKHLTADEVDRVMDFLDGEGVRGTVERLGPDGPVTQVVKLV